MKKMIPVLVALGLILVIVLGALGFRFVKRYIPSDERADLSRLYDVSGDQVAVLYQDSLQESKGIYRNGQTYLPLTWVNENINKRFYWDSTEDLLVYALPDQIVYADAGTVGSSGAPLLLEEEGEIYLALGLVSNYTNRQFLAFDSGDVKRVLIGEWGSRQISVLKKDGKVREDSSIKSPIVTDAARGYEVKVLESEDGWSRVETADGHVGYIQDRFLEEPETREVTGDFTEPVYNGTSVDGKVTLAWHQVTTMDANDQLAGLVAVTDGVNVISPTWFSLTDNEGNYKSLASREYVDQAHSMGLQVWALMDNFSDDVQTEVLLASTSTRRKLINSLMADVEKYDLDGLNMDFEGLKPEAGVHYIQFLRELSIPCREKGIILSVDNYVPASYNDFYDREEQGIVTDYVIIMGYDEHYAGGEAGSVASIEYVRGGIQRTLEDVPKEKVINGVPFYTRLWTETDDGWKSSALGIKKAKEWVEENHVELYWQKELCQYYGEFQSEEGMQYIWMEEEDSLREKMNVIKEYDLAGVACWKLGLEDAAAWEAISWD